MMSGHLGIRRKMLLYRGRLLYNALVRMRLPVVIFVVWMTGCAGQPVHSGPSSKPPRQVDAHSVPSSAASAAGRVTLPYTFARHGVEIRVNSIEFEESRVLVNVTIQETRDQTFDFPLSTLMQTLTPRSEEHTSALQSR